ncbi:MAG: DUF2513 domain-containing protein [Myxococcales bacterium]|nr:DUF2513 domain-containing protein [Myxococcales bacterium]
MRRDPDLIRQVLLDIEDEKTSQVADKNPDLYAGHVRLCRDAGYVSWHEELVQQEQVRTLYLTWKGCEVLALVREVTRFMNCKRRFAGKDFPLELLLDILHQELRKGVT